MNTMTIDRAALLAAAWQPSAAQTARPATRHQSAADTRASIERQLDEIQHTFGVRWEW